MLLIALSTLGVIALVWFSIVSFNTYRRYEELRLECNATPFSVMPITSVEQTRIREVVANWDLRHEGSSLNAENEALVLAGYSPNVSGLVAFWSEEMPPFSFTDLGRNKLWVVRASLRNLIFPQPVQYFHGEGLLFSERPGHIEIIQDITGGFESRIYKQKKDSNTSEIATPVKPSD